VLRPVRVGYCAFRGLTNTSNETVQHRHERRESRTLSSAN